jgi:hypothetical protein
LSDVIGRAKDLAETVAKVVISAIDGTVDDKLDLQPLLKAAQAALKFQPGPGLSHDEDLRTIAQSVQTVATRLAPIRNTYGTGHGRARNPDVGDELGSLSLEAALMWTRWALRRLGHLLADYPNDLIDAVQTGTTRVKLREKFDAAVLVQQPAEIQRRIGVAFGQQSAGGFFNATDVGVAPIVDGGFDQYPVEYRSGVLEGMLLRPGGEIGLISSHASWFASLFRSLPEKDARDLSAALVPTLTDASWIDTWRGAPVTDPTAVVARLRIEGEDLTESHAKAFAELLETLEAAATSAASDET